MVTLSKYKIILSLFIATLCSVQSPTLCREMYFVTVSDSEHFPWLQRLITSILKHNASNVSKIAVFDLGLTPCEIDTLHQIDVLQVYPLEDVNPEMRKKFVARPNGRLVRGWYSWKPVVFYQALQMFPYFIYADSGVEIAAPSDDIFDEIQREGYCFFESDGSPTYPTATNHVRKLFDLDNPQNQWILMQRSLSGSTQGLSRAVLHSYVEPVYRLAANIKNFEDDGTAPWGFGGARHDQTLFSIVASSLHLKIHPLHYREKYFHNRKHNECDPALVEHGKKHNLWG